MDWKIRKRPRAGLICELGAVVLLAGFVGGFYSPATAIVLALSVWIIGTTLLNLWTP